VEAICDILVFLLNNTNAIVYLTFESSVGYVCHGFQWLSFDMLFTMIFIYTIVKSMKLFTKASSIVQLT
jgi:hypothetical protein